MAAVHQASVQDGEFEDPHTFWSRSNARLGMDASYFGHNSRDGKKGSGRPPVEFPCAVCGVWVMLERWPKDRHDVRCDNCKQAVGKLLTGDERKIATDHRRQRKAEAKGKYEGLPQMTDEDKAAIKEMRALSDVMGNGRVGNRRGKGGSKNKRNRRHRGNDRSNDGGGGGRRRGGGGGGGGGGRGGRRRGRGGR